MTVASRRTLAAALALALTVTACSSSSKPSSTSGKGSGPVDVLYAGSLVDLMNNDIGPAFHSATGYTLSGTSGDSGSLANEVKAKTIVGDVYISANPSKDEGLEGSSNGNWVSWYATFATSPLVLGYNPHSRFATDLETEPWYQAIVKPGILVGRTDPATDPKGVLTVTALDAAATTDNEPRLKSIGTSTADVFPENTLVGRLQAGQLDAGFFYSVEATAANIPTRPVTVTGKKLDAVYTITILDDAPHQAAADAFVTFLLGSQGTALLEKAGLQLQSPPTVSGTAPSSLSSVLSG